MTGHQPPPAVLNEALGFCLDWEKFVSIWGGLSKTIKGMTFPHLSVLGGSGCHAFPCVCVSSAVFGSTGICAAGSKGQDSVQGKEKLSLAGGVKDDFLGEERCEQCFERQSRFGVERQAGQLAAVKKLFRGEESGCPPLKSVSHLPCCCW